MLSCELYADSWQCGRFEGAAGKRKGIRIRFRPKDDFDEPIAFVADIMRFRILESVIVMDDPWTSIKTYFVGDVTKDEIRLTTPTGYLKSEYIRSIARDNFSKLAPNPFALDYSPESYPGVEWVDNIRELASIEIQKGNGNSVVDLIKRIGDRINVAGEKKFVEWGLRVWVRNGVFQASEKVVGGKAVVGLKLTGKQKTKEEERRFSATIGGELTALSGRVGQIISHAPTVGTYREDILRSVLQRHLPERYHIATGFIYGFERQIDILIYDRVDHAPLFREGDLVVVPKESVRAVIEVKTTLTAARLRHSIEMLGEASRFDCEEPFFRGIFAFKSDISKEKIVMEIKRLFVPDPASLHDGDGREHIFWPFSHFGCICVHEAAFAFVAYQKNSNNRFIPYLYTKESALGLKS